MRTIYKRLASLSQLARPLALTFVGIVLLSLGVAYFVIAIYRDAMLPEFFYYLTLQFMPRYTRGALLALLGLVVLALGIWRLSGVVVIRLNAAQMDQGPVVLGFRRESAPPRIAVLSGGPGIMILASLGRHAQRMICITPLQDPVEYYYRAASLFNFENVIYMPPTPQAIQVYAELDDGSRWNIKHQIGHDDHLAVRHVVNLSLSNGSSDNRTVPQIDVFRQTIDALSQVDLIIFGPGSLFECIVPNLLIPEVRDAIRRSKARKLYICNLMTEPGMTTEFSVADHIRQIVRFGGFTPDYVLVNAQRIEPEIRRIYEAANQKPVYLSPEEYEETVVSLTEQTTARDLVVEGAIVIEADLASSVVQLTASLDNPGNQRAVRVLRHDPEKLTAAILGILERM
jgi:2-phospho-L-lactate transferase/gluconeogenesis factor (CofD/UPF0052 family)